MQCMEQRPIVGTDKWDSTLQIRGHWNGMSKLCQPGNVQLLCCLHYSYVSVPSIRQIAVVRFAAAFLVIMIRHLRVRAAVCVTTAAAIFICHWSYQTFLPQIFYLHIFVVVADYELAAICVFLVQQYYVWLIIFRFCSPVGAFWSQIASQITGEVNLLFLSIRMDWDAWLQPQKVRILYANYIVHVQVFASRHQQSTWFGKRAENYGRLNNRETSISITTIWRCICGDKWHQHRSNATSDGTDVKTRSQQ